MTDIKELFDWRWDERKIAEAADWVPVVASVSDFENGDRAALMAGIRRFAEEYDYAVRPTDLVDALTRANSFDPRTIKAVGSDD